MASTTSEDSGIGNYDDSTRLLLGMFSKVIGELESAAEVFCKRIESFNQEEEKRFSQELLLIRKRLENFVRKGLASLSQDKDLFLQQLSEFDDAEVAKLVDFRREVGEILKREVFEAERTLSDIVQRQLADLKPFVNSHEEQLRTLAAASVGALQSFLKESNQRIERIAQSHVESLSEQSDAVRKQMEQSLEESQELLGAHFDKLTDNSSDKAENCVQSIGKASEEAECELERQMMEGAITCANAATEALSHLSTDLDEWKRYTGELDTSFKTALIQLSDMLKSAYITSFDNLKKQCVGDIDELSQQANDRLNSAQSDFEAQMSRLRQQYMLALENALDKLEEDLQKAARHSVDPERLSERELRAAMRAEIRSWRLELLQAMQKSFEQMEHDYLKATDGFCHEIDQSRNHIIEEMETAVRSNERALDLLMRQFADDFRELEPQILQVEDAGRAAATTVAAYKMTLLSVDS